MIGYLKGRLHTIQEDAIILDVGGVGYHVFLPESKLQTLTPIGTEIELHIVTISREDALHLYGFENALEKRLFNLLLTVSGIGPRQATHILSSCQVDQLIHAVSDHNTAFLQSIRGIGRKSAEKIIIDLKAPMKKLLKEGSQPELAKSISPLTSDLVAALEQLGYRRQQIDSAIARLPKEKELSLEAAIKACLRYLSGVRELHE